MRHAWIDFEATSYDAKTAVPFEAAVILTDDLEEISGGSFTLTVRWTKAQIAQFEMDPEVQRMHTHNGLLGALPYGVPLTDLDDALADFMVKHQPDSGGQYRVAGRGITVFDIPFAQRVFPRFWRTLNPKPLDINQQRWFLRDVVNRQDLLWEGKQGRKAHRAMNDVRDHLEEARYYRDMFGEALADYT